MSHSIEVRCDRSRLPSVSMWNQAIESRGFDAEILGFEWSDANGCVDAKLLGYTVPLELFQTEDSSSSDSNSGFLGRLLGGKKKSAESQAGSAIEGPVSIEFVLHSSLYELALASIASLALAEATGGTASYEGEETDLEEDVEAARNVYVEAMLYIARLDAGKAGLPWDAPALLPFETKESRLAAISSASDLRLAEDSSPDDQRWYLKSVRLTDHREQLGLADQNEVGSS